MRKDFCSPKRGKFEKIEEIEGQNLQMYPNITRIERWCKVNNMPERTLQLKHLTQATKLLQLKKVKKNYSVLSSGLH